MSETFIHKTVDGATGETTLVPFTDEEVAAVRAYRTETFPAEQLKALRTRRNQLLAETDYLALADATLTDEMTAYRQALRDLPANTTDPANPVWPTKPGGES
jgi:hypothetical protein